MSRKYLFILLLVHGVLTEECVRYSFEDYDDLFTTEILACNNLESWRLGTYDDSTIEAPNEKSEWFISPSSSNLNVLSCTGSFTFTMMPHALVEVLVYIERGTDLSLSVILYQIQNSNHPAVGQATLGNDLKNGWHVLSIRNSFNRDESFQGYVAFLGRASEDSVLIVDSFRYVPLTEDPEHECILYEDIPAPDLGDTTIADTTIADTTIADTTIADTTIADTTIADTTIADTTIADTTIADTTIADTTIADTTTVVTTESAITDSGTDPDSFWSPLTITITVLVCLIVLVIVAALSYYIGGLMARKKEKVEDDIDYNVPQILPRVTKVYPEINSNKYNTQP